MSAEMSTEWMTEISIGLVHGPVLNKRGKEVTTSVTNLDIHDIARISRTFGIKNYFLITPIKVQQDLVARILGYWKMDEANEYNPDRFDALGTIQVVSSIAEASKHLGHQGKTPLVAVTGAQISQGDGSAQDLLDLVQREQRPLLVLFGTGYGLSPKVVESADFCLKHLAGAAEDGYNHLSVRAAVAIYCDRLRGAR